MSGFHLWKVALVCFLIHGTFLGYSGLRNEAAAQPKPTTSPSESKKANESRASRNIVPFSGYEERLRQSPRWKTMTPEEQEKVLEKLETARKKFLDQQQQLNSQYEDQINKMKKPRESLMSKRRKRAQYQDVDTLWSRLQSLPIEKRMAMERQLGLDRVAPSQQQSQFQKRLDGLSFAKRSYIIQQLQQMSP